MKTIHKYVLELERFQSIETHEYYGPMTAQMQDGKLVMWAIVDTRQPLVRKSIAIHGTGFDMDDRDENRDISLGSPGYYVGSVQTDGYTWHVFCAL